LWKWMRHKPRHSTNNDPKSIVPFGNLATLPPIDLHLILLDFWKIKLDELDF
jgi:hypothetical protein